ncbi:uncharacterized protein LOC127266146 isoform X2 [Andrographis paniculata]|uniref:uncharacterized protein LOC127266146 isoform X2 n=1 Tax=Andrographis paniculata TaxID=175694 RepID=UPI0021E92B37|nr:uncharacterized protein LOC127266146 isoform X2 [Andrographis paniculata]
MGIHLILEEYRAMEFKGIAWAGNLYERFEAMCLEVEDVLASEDAVKYMENQVQKVGVSVKKFYSDVVQDFLPTSCINPIKVAAPELLWSPDDRADNNKKPKLCINEAQGGEVKNEKSLNDDTISQFPQSCRVIVETTNPGLSSARSKKLGACKRSVGIKRISQTRHPLRKSDPASCLCAVHDVRKGCSFSSSETNVTEFSETSPKHSPEEAEAEMASSASDKVLSVESPRQEEDNADCTSSSHGTSVKETSLSNSGLSVASNASDFSSATSDEATLVQDDGTISQTNFNIIDHKSFVRYEEYFEMEVRFDEEFEISKSDDDDDTCVLVEDDLLVSEETDKHKSYKKKLREALSAKLRPWRNQTQPISRNTDLDEKKINEDATIPDVTSNSGSAEGRDSFGADWELI